MQVYLVATLILISLYSHIFHHVLFLGAFSTWTKLGADPLDVNLNDMRLFQTVSLRMFGTAFHKTLSKSWPITDILWGACISWQRALNVVDETALNDHLTMFWLCNNQYAMHNVSLFSKTCAFNFVLLHCYYNILTITFVSMFLFREKSDWLIVIIMNKSTLSQFYVMLL